MTKRLLSIILCISMVLVLVACSAKNVSEAPAEPAKEAQSEAPAASEAPADAEKVPAEETEDLKPIKFALYAPLTGNNAQYGLTYQKTIEALKDKINAEGGIDGREVVVEVFDDKADQKEALNIANLIVSDPEIVGVIGSQTSSPSLAAAPIFAKAGIPMISPNASHGDLTPIGEGIFSISCLSDFEGGQTAYRMADDGCKVSAIIYSNDDNGVYINDIWQKLAAERQLEVPVTENFVPGSTSDFTPILSKIKAAGVDSMFVCASYADVAMIMNQMIQLEMNDIEVYTNSTSYNQAFLDAAGDAAEGLNICNYFFDGSTDETFVELEKLIKEKTDIEMMSIYVTNAHDAFMLLIDAVKAVGTDGDAIAKWLAEVKDWPGACGPITFDETRHPAKHLYWFKIQDQTFEFVSQQY